MLISEFDPCATSMPHQDGVAQISNFEWIFRVARPCCVGN